MMANEWHYASGEHRNGPVSIDEMVSLAKAGALNLNTLVWQTGQAEWLKLRDVSQLQELARLIPPDLPSADTDSASHRGGQTGAMLAVPTPRIAGPWRRFFARNLDILLIGTPTAMLAADLLRANSAQFRQLMEEGPAPWYLLGWMCAPLVMLLEALVYAPFRTTPGKALLGVEVLNKNGERVGFTGYLHRQAGVFWSGLALAFPIISIFAMGRQHDRVKRGEPTTYDSGRFSVESRPFGLLRGVGLSVAGIFILLTGFILMTEGKMKQAEGEADQETAAAREALPEPVTQQWVNPTTGKSVTIPHPWKPLTTVNESGEERYHFQRRFGGRYTLIPVANSGSRLSLESYAFALTKSASEHYAFFEPEVISFFGERALKMIGLPTQPGPATNIITVTIFRRGETLWSLAWSNGMSQDGGEADFEKLIMDSF